jgi:phage virion morphogenesis protein
MAEPIRIEVDSKPVLKALQHMIDAGRDLAPALEEIGEHLKETTKRRFGASTGPPDGERWPANSDVTLQRYLDMFKGSRKKDGDLSKKGAQRVGAKKPLIGETGNLSLTIAYVVRGNTLEVGSPEIYAGVQQFGAKQGAFGSNRRGAPIPWGDIPARPFLGLSSDDERMVLDVISDHLLSASGAP